MLTDPRSLRKSYLEQIEGFITELKRRNIGASVHFIPIHMHSYYRHRYDLRPDQFPVAQREFERMLSLPLSPAHSDEDVADVIQAVGEIVRENPSRIRTVA